MNFIIRSSLRKIHKHAINFAIQLIGLTIGIVSLLFIHFWIVSEKSYDTAWKGSEQVYRVALDRSANGNKTFRTAMNFRGTASVLKDGIPEIETATTLNKDIITVFTPQASVQNIDMFFTDSTFFGVFPLTFVKRTEAYPLSGMHDAVMSRSLAARLFGGADPINRSFKLNEGWEFTVVAVFDDVAENSHIRFDLLLHQRALRYYMRNFNYATGMLNLDNLSAYSDPDPYSQSQWSSNRTYTYIRLRPGSSIGQVAAKYGKTIEPCVAHLTAKNEQVAFDFQSISQIHLHSDRNNELGNNGSHFKLLAFRLIAILILVSSYLNYINISAADYHHNRQTHTLHRILGAGKLRLFAVFTADAFVVNCLAVAIAFVLGAIFLTKGVTISGFHIFPVDMGALCGVCAVLMVAGTLMPAVYLYYRARSRRSDDKTPNRSTKGLVVFQFAASVFLIIGTMLIFKQMRYMQQADTGMDIEQTMASFSPMTMIKKPDEQQRLQTFRQEVQKIPGVAAFTTAEIMAGKPYDRFSSEVRLADSDNAPSTFALANVDFDYVSFFGIGLLSGDMFAETTPYDRDEIMVNTAACRALGLTPVDAVDKQVHVGNNSYRIKGVIADHHHLSLKDGIDPVIYFNSLKWFRTVGHYFVKISPRQMPATVDAVTALWNRIYPLEEYHFSFLDERFNQAYQADTNFGHVFMALSGLAIFIACMGLWAMARFLTLAKTKEIGIRKINGATIPEILVLLNRSFIKWVVLAFVFAAPLSWYAMHCWQQNFAYKTELSWWVFILSGVTAVTIAAITVSWQSWRAAVRNPVEALKHE
ncbi:MAG: hypothetical protein QM786_02530 [Breznakibacter sp.]